MKNLKVVIVSILLSLILVGCGGETKKEFYSNGALKYVAEYNSDSQLDGEYKSYTRKGKVDTIKHYSDGLLDGEYIEYYENEKVKKSCNYLKDKLDGEYITYYKNGKVKIETSFNKGKKDGKLLEYWENGHLAFEEEYDDDKLIGTKKVYNDNEKIIAMYNYNSEGMLDGDFFRMYNGEKNIVAVFEDGVLKSGYAYPKRVIKGFGFRKSKITLGSKIVLKNNNNFYNIMLKNNFINLLDQIKGLK